MLNKLVQCTEVMTILKAWKRCQESLEISSCSVDGERVYLGSDKTLSHRDDLAELSFCSAAWDCPLPTFMRQSCKLWDTNAKPEKLLLHRQHLAPFDGLHKQMPLHKCQYFSSGSPSVISTGYFPITLPAANDSSMQPSHLWASIDIQLSKAKEDTSFFSSIKTDVFWVNRYRAVDQHLVSVTFSFSLLSPTWHWNPIPHLRREHNQTLNKSPIGTSHDVILATHSQTTVTLIKQAL